MERKRRVWCVSEVWGVMVQKGSWTLPLLSDFSLVCYTWVFLKLGTYWELQWSTMGLTRDDCGWLCWPWVVIACRGFEDHRPEGEKHILRSYRQCGSPCSLSSLINSYLNFRTHKAWAIWFCLTSLAHPVLHISEVRGGAKDEVSQVCGWWIAEVGPNSDWKHPDHTHFLLLPAGTLMSWHCGDACVSATAMPIVFECTT